MRHRTDSYWGADEKAAHCWTGASCFADCGCLAFCSWWFCCRLFWLWLIRPARNKEINNSPLRFHFVKDANQVGNIRVFDAVFFDTIAIQISKCWNGGWFGCGEICPAERGLSGEWRRSRNVLSRTSCRLQMCKAPRSTSKKNNKKILAVNDNASVESQLVTSVANAPFA